eukprot:PLAT305.1.p1 GENE.PLAT305.1~~PLAT305.1.p1  ORF type:complete len:539 (-),score=133.40 PLAT305.1:15-1631(-)
MAGCSDVGVGCGTVRAADGRLRRVPGTMSAGEESKASVSVEEPGRGAGDVADEAVWQLSDDVWGLILRCIRPADSKALGSACSWLHDVVLRNISFLCLTASPPAFSAARLTSVQHISLFREVDLAAVLPVLHNCPQLRELQLFCMQPAQIEAAVDNIPLFSRLQKVSLIWPPVTGLLGKALVACSTLRQVELSMCGPRGRQDGRRDIVADFLRELTALPSLRSLYGVQLRDEEDVRQLCAAVGAWPELQELHVISAPDWDGDLDLEAPLDGIAAAVARSCPAMRSFSMAYEEFEETRLSRADVEAIASMAELRRLQLSGVPMAVFSPLRSMPVIEELVLSNCSMDEDAYRQIPVVVQQLPLKTLRFAQILFPAEVNVALLRAIAASGSLTTVAFNGIVSNPDDVEMQTMATALAEAVCLSPVRSWQLDTPLCLLSLLRGWNARTPAAAVRSLNLWYVNCLASADEEDAALLLRCLRSCAVLREVKLGLWFGSVDAVVAAVQAEPLSPATLGLRVSREDMSKYEGVLEELKAVGLVLVT